VSRGGVCPVSWTQDQVGPIGRSVEDVMRVLEVISGAYDERDNVTAVYSFSPGRWMLIVAWASV
jgi:amidase